MGETLMQQRRVKEEGLWVVNFCPLLGVRFEIRFYLYDLYLDGCEPIGERSGVVFDQDPHEAFHAAEDRPVEHDGPVFRSVVSDVTHVEFLGHLKVELDRPALPGASDAVLQMIVDLGAVKRAVPGVEPVGGSRLLQRLLQLVFGELPEG